MEPSPDRPADHGFAIVTARSADPVPPRLAEALVSAGLGGALQWAGDLGHVEGGALRVAIVGTRTPTAESEAAIGALAGLITRAGAVVVSGAALGTDMAAHRGALAAGGSTIACVPMALDQIEWSTWRADFAPFVGLARRLLLIAPFPPGTTINRQTPVIRNRLIAALADVVVAGEALVDSGTHHCLAFARRLGVPCFVLGPLAGGAPGQVEAFTQLRGAGAMPVNISDLATEGFAELVLHHARARRAAVDEARAATLDLFAPDDGYGTGPL
jgi:DNA processing protein